MRSEISDLEHHDLFASNMKKLRYEIEELNKMLESRIDNLTKPLCDEDLSTSSYKTLRTETFRAVDAAEGMSKLIYKRLNESLEKSFERIEKEDERKKEE